MTLSEIESNIAKFTERLSAASSEIVKFESKSRQARFESGNSKTDADALAAEMSAAYSQAVAAFSAGDKAAAASLSSQGRDLEAQVRALNARHAAMKNDCFEYSKGIRNLQQESRTFREEIARLKNVRNTFLNREKKNNDRIVKILNSIPGNTQPTIFIGLESVEVGSTVNSSGSPSPFLVLSAKDFENLSDVNAENLLLFVGQAEKSSTFTDLMVQNDSATRARRRKLFQAMCNIESSSPALKKVLEPLWQGIAFAQELEDGGHSVARHGSTLKDVELIRRLEHGVAPDNVFRPTSASTRFNSFKDWVLTREAVYSAIEDTFVGVDFGKGSVSGPIKYAIHVEYDRPSDDGFVGDVSHKKTIYLPQNIRIKGKGYDKWISVSGITRTMSILKWNGKRWCLAQHCPIGTGWNDSTKSYYPAKTGKVNQLVFSQLPK
ncbi:MAG: putative nuclear RNA export factor SDE5 [Pyrinomonadaceae bacterium]